MGFNQQEVSPVTGIIDESWVIIDFGHHLGRTVSEIYEIDKEFYNKLSHLKDTGNYAIRRHTDKTFRLYMNPLFAMENTN